MKRAGKKLIALMTVVLAVGMTGCFGESIVTAGAKVAAGQISELTANEIKILNQTIVDLLNASNPNAPAVTLTDAQAEALANFFAANDLNTFEDFDELDEMIQEDPSQVQGLDELAAAFQGTDEEFDADNLDESELDSILEAVLEGV